jgi:hypothetical protein
VCALACWSWMLAYVGLAASELLVTQTMHVPSVHTATIVKGLVDAPVAEFQRCNLAWQWFAQAASAAKQRLDCETSSSEPAYLPGMRVKSALARAAGALRVVGECSPKSPSPAALVYVCTR